MPRTSRHGLSVLFGRVGAVAVLGLCLVLTFWVWAHERAAVRERAASYFSYRVATIKDAVDRRLEGYEEVLRAGAGVIAAADVLSQHEWNRFVQQLQLPDHYPGVTAMGFAVRADAELLPRVMQNIQQAVGSGFTITPSGERDVYFPVVYFAAMDATAGDAVGRDLYADAVQREAIWRARDTGEPAVTGRITLADGTPGFVMFLPVYVQDDTPATVAARRSELAGLVFGVFKAGVMVQSAIGTAYGDVALEIYDGERATQAPLYASNPPPEPDADLNALSRLNLPGRTWHLHLTAQPALAQGLLASQQPQWLLAGGLLTSLLLFALFWNLATTQKRAAALARRMTQAWRESEAKYGSLVNAAADAVLITDSRGAVVAWNRAASRIYGYSEREILGRPWTDLLPERLREAAARQVRRLLHDPRPRLAGRVVDLTARRVNGEEFPAEVSLARWGSGTDLFVSGIIRDVTERRQAEEALRLSEARFRVTFEHAAIGMLLLDIEGQVLAANPAFLRMIGCTLDELKRFGPLRHIHPLDQPESAALLTQLREGQSPLRQRLRYESTDGRTLWASLTASLVARPAHRHSWLSS